MKIEFFMLAALLEFLFHISKTIAYIQYRPVRSDDTSSSYVMPKPTSSFTHYCQFC